MLEFVDSVLPVTAVDTDIDTDIDEEEETEEQENEAPLAE